LLIDKINNRFGSKRGLLNSTKFKILFLLGKYKKYQKVDFDRVEHLVFVCSGNICRSSLAEYVAKSFGISSESFGLHCRGGDSADVRAIEFAEKQGIDMKNHLTRNIKSYLPKSSDLIIAMEPAHIQELEALGLSEFQITTLPVWAINNIYLHDPFNSNETFFERCETIVMQGTIKLKEKLSNISNKELNNSY